MGSYSARVRLELHVGSTCIRLAQIGGNRLIFRKPTILLGTEGEVRAYIDEHVQRWWAKWEASESPQEIVKVTFKCALDTNPPLPRQYPR